jgi:hypothetical protein
MAARQTSCILYSGPWIENGQADLFSFWGHGEASSGRCPINFERHPISNMATRQTSWILHTWIFAFRTITGEWVVQLISYFSGTVVWIGGGALLIWDPIWLPGRQQMSKSKGLMGHVHVNCRNALHLLGIIKFLCFALIDAMTSSHHCNYWSGSDVSFMRQIPIASVFDLCTIW